MKEMIEEMVRAKLMKDDAENSFEAAGRHYRDVCQDFINRYSSEEDKVFDYLVRIDDRSYVISVDEDYWDDMPATRAVGIKPVRSL